MSGARLICLVTAIGIVDTRRAGVESTPIEAALHQDEHGMVDLSEPVAEGLSGLEGLTTRGC